MSRITWVVGAVLLVGCSDDSNVPRQHGGGSVTFSLAPLDAEGLTVEVTVPGADKAGLNNTGSCVSYMDQRIRHGEYQRFMQVCAEDLPVASDGCFDTFDVELGVFEDTTYADLYNGEGYEGEEDLIDSAPISQEWVGIMEGTFTGEFDLSHPCLGPDPVRHRIEINWSFDFTRETPGDGGGGGGGGSWLGDV